MQRSHVILGVGALALIGAAAWLFHEVNATPAEAAITAKQIEDAGVTEVTPKANVPPTADLPAATKLGLGKRLNGSGESDPAHERVTKPIGDAHPSIDTGDVPEKANPRWDAVLDEVNRSYDHGDFDEAKTQAITVLKHDPTNARMLRVAVSSSCILGDSGDAQTYYAKLTSPRDREQMKTRCDRYGVTFTDPK